MKFDVCEYFCLRKAGLKMIIIIIAASRISNGLQIRRMILIMMCTKDDETSHVHVLGALYN